MLLVWLILLILVLVGGYVYLQSLGKSTTSVPWLSPPITTSPSAPLLQTTDPLTFPPITTSPSAPLLQTTDPWTFPPLTTPLLQTTAIPTSQKPYCSTGTTLLYDKVKGYIDPTNNAACECAPGMVFDAAVPACNPPTTTTTTTPAPVPANYSCPPWTCKYLKNKYNGITTWEGADMTAADNYAWWTLNCNNEGMTRDADTQSRIDAMNVALPGFASGANAVCNPGLAFGPNDPNAAIPAGYHENDMGLIVSDVTPAPVTGAPGVTAPPTKAAQRFVVMYDWAHYLDDPNYNANLISMTPNQSAVECRDLCDNTPECTHTSWVHGQLVGGGRVLPAETCSMFKNSAYLGTAPFIADAIINCTALPDHESCQPGFVSTPRFGAPDF